MSQLLTVEEVEVDQFYEDQQRLLEHFIIGYWNAKVGSQERPKQASLALEYRLNQGEG